MDGVAKWLAARVHPAHRDPRVLVGQAKVVVSNIANRKPPRPPRERNVIALAMVRAVAAAAAKNALYRFNGGKMFKGASVNKKDAVATIVEYKRRDGATVEAKIYDGFVIARDEQYELSKSGAGKGDKTETHAYKLSHDGQNEGSIPALYTVANNKIYKGDSTEDAQCVLSYTGEFNASRLLFMAIELQKK